MLIDLVVALKRGGPSLHARTFLASTEVFSLKYLCSLYIQRQEHSFKTPKVILRAKESRQDKAKDPPRVGFDYTTTDI
jgi:hypothetical protein